MKFSRLWNYLFGSTFRAGASILTVLTLASYILGLARDMLFSRLLGASRILDIYNAAFVVPDMMLNVFIAASLTAAFVPVFSHLRAHGEVEESERVATTMLVAAPGAMLIISGIAFLFMPFLAHIVAPGFSTSELSLLVHMSRLMLLSSIMFALSNTLGSTLISLDRFTAYGFSSVLYNLGIISGVFLIPWFGPIGLIVGTLIGALLHLSVRVFATFRSQFTLRGPIDLANQHFRQILKLMLPRMAGQPIEQLTFSLFTSLASTLTVGSIAVVNFARNFQSVPIGIFGIAFSTAVFASLSRKAATKEREGFMYHLKETAKPLLVVSTLSALFYIFFGTWVIGILLGGGRFDTAAIARTGRLLAIFALAIPAESLIHLLVRAFYAVKDTWTPIFVSVPGLGLIWVLSKALIPSLGLNALGISYVIAQIAEVILLWLLLQRHLRKLSA